MNLFEGSATQVRLTSFGIEFVKRARDILRSVDALSDLARASQFGLVGRLRIGVVPTAAPYLLSTILWNLSRSDPGLDTNAGETVTTKPIQKISN
jgi:LysR family transcriptional regulator, hydrogen peroxide-inducible genes activator